MKKQTTETTEIIEFLLNESDLINVIRDSQPFMGYGPEWEVKLRVKIPGGGDYSNMSLSVNECPVTLTLKRTRKETKQ